MSGRFSDKKLNEIIEDSGLDWYYFAMDCLLGSLSLIYLILILKYGNLCQNLLLKILFESALGIILIIVGIIYNLLFQMG